MLPQIYQISQEKNQYPPKYNKVYSIKIVYYKLYCQILQSILRKYKDTQKERKMKDKKLWYMAETNININCKPSLLVIS